MLRTVLVLTATLGFCSLIALAQPADKKGDAVKGKDDDKTKAKEPIKPKPPEKSEVPKDAPKAKTPLDKLKLPKDAVVIILDDPLEAATMFGKSAILSFEEYLNLKETIKVLERQLKPDKKVPFSCKLSGELEGDFLVFRGAEFIFSTETPNTTVQLGLQGGHLLNVGDLDGQVPILNHHKDDGFIVQVEKEAKRHQLTLNFRVPVQLRKSPAGAVERGIDLALPGSIVTAVNLKLPGNIKELRCNDNSEKPRSPGNWELGLPEKGKTLSLTWKESIAQAGNTPLVKAEAQIKVDIDATHVNVGAELFLEDKRPQTKEWRLLLPKLAKVKAPAELTHEPPTEKIPYHVLRVADATAERWQVSVSLRVPRATPGARTAIGPFHVLGAFQQHGTISVKMPAEIGLGQRLAYARGDGVYEVFQTKNAETEAVFNYNYLGPLVTDKNLKAAPVLKAPLELEWRFEKNQLETQVKHDLNLQTASDGWEIDMATRIHVKALFAGINTIDLKLPQPRPRGVAIVGSAAAGLGFPGIVPWAGVWKTFGSPWTFAHADEFTVYDEALDKELNVSPIDGTGKIRVFLDRAPPPKEVNLVLKSKVRLPPQTQRIRLEMPRPLSTQDRGAKLTIKADERIEILDGPPGAEEPTPDRDRFDRSWDQTPGVLDVAWRPFHRETIARTEIDVTIFEHTAQVKQTLRFPSDASRNPKNAPVTFQLPPGMSRPQITVGKFISDDENLRTFRVQPAVADAGADIMLEYDLPIAKTQLFRMTPIWPANISQNQVKLRVWSAPEIIPRLTDEAVRQGLWKERSIEAVPGKEQFPALVLQGNGSDLPLTLKIEDVSATTLAAFQADRALMQVRNMEDGGQQCKARYLIRKIHAPHVDLELPLELSFFREPPVFKLGTQVLRAEPLDKAGKALRVKLHPDRIALPAVLEISYTIPTEGVDGSSFWRTTLRPPAFHSEVVVSQMRWQLATQAPILVGSWGRSVRSHVQWNMQNGLPTPEASVSSANADAWLKGKEFSQEPSDVAYSFALVSMQPETVYHLHKRWWLLACSGFVLIVGLGGYLSPMSRPLFWMLLAVAALGVLSLGLLAPGMLPPVLFGAQPGIALFVVIVAIHWLIQERQRRQEAHSSGFSQAKPSSTMLRTSASKRPREASTVDAPGTQEGDPASSEPV